MTAIAQKRFLLTLLTVVWIITVPLVIMFFVKVLRWPLSLAILIFLPIFAFWIPFSYPLALQGGSHYLRASKQSSSKMRLHSALLALLTCILGTLLIWIYGLVTTASYGSAAVAGLVVVLFGWLASKVGRDMTRTIGGD